MEKKRTIIALAISLFAFAISGGPVMAENFFPATLGNWWKLELDGVPGYGQMATIIGKANLFGVENVAVLEMEGFSPTAKQYSFAYGVELDGVFYSYAGGFAAQVSYKLAELGTTWTYSETNGVIVKVTVVAKEEVVVPKGSFQGCYCFKKEAMNNGAVIYSWEEWLHPGTGIVKTVYDTHTLAPTTLVLVDYFLK
jgi:hypothetical protein